MANNMTTTTARGNTLAPKKDEGKIGAYLGRTDIRVWLNGVLGNQRTAEKFVANVTSAVATNPTLATCRPSTIVSGALVANALNLPLSASLGRCYLLPFNNSKEGTKDAVFCLGYKGYVELAIRSGYYRKLNVVPIKQGELISWNELTEEIEVELIEDAAIRENTPTEGYYAYFEQINGFRKQMYWTVSKMQVHADTYVPAYKLEVDRLIKEGKIPQKDMWKYSSYWYTNFDAMAMKTMLRQLLSRWGTLSIDLIKAIEQDGDYNKTEFFDSNSPAPTAEPEQQPEQTDETASEDDDDFDFYAGLADEEDGES
ncbi:MAG: recombinase RecT [Candidatus Coproplasma sp.]